MHLFVVEATKWCSYMHSSNNIVHCLFEHRVGWSVKRTMYLMLWWYYCGINSWIKWINQKFKWWSICVLKTAILPTQQIWVLASLLSFLINLGSRTRTLVDQLHHVTFQIQVLLLGRVHNYFTALRFCYLPRMSTFESSTRWASRNIFGSLSKDEDAKE